MQDIKQLKEEWNHQCFCTEDSLKHATNACKYEKEKIADWWLEKLSLAVEQAYVEFRKLSVKEIEMLVEQEKAQLIKKAEEKYKAGLLCRTCGKYHLEEIITLINNK